MRIAQNTEYYTVPEPIKEDKWLRLSRKIQKKLKRNNQPKTYNASSVSVTSDSDSSDDRNSDIHFGNSVQFIENTVDLINRLYPIPESILREDTTSSFYIFRTDNNVVLMRGVIGYENAKMKTTALRKRFGLKFDQVKFKKERKPNTNQYYRGGRIERANRYNPSKRTNFKGVSYPDGSYVDLD